MKRNAYFATCSSLVVLWLRRTTAARIDRLRGRREGALRPSYRSPPLSLVGAHPAAGWHGPALEPEETSLRLEPAAVPAKRPVRGEHAVARDDDRHRVRAERGAGRTRRLRAPGLRRHRRVRRDIAVPHAGRRAEDPLLERRERREIDGHGERA